MDLLKLITFIWTFYGLVADLEASCPKGYARRGKNCEPCAESYYQDKDHHTGRCKPCSICNTDTGSKVVKKCSATRNSECQCPKGSESLESDSVTCKCPIGRGLHNGECVKCEEGYFSEKPNSSCQKWSECSSGVKENGSNAKNVVCKPPETTTEPPSKSAPSWTTSSTSSQTQKTPTQATTPPLRSTVTPKVKNLAPNSSYTDNHIGMALIILGIIGLLILTALTCKLRISTYMQRKTKPRDSLCRKPVEESGDSSLTLIKPNPEEP